MILDIRLETFVGANETSKIKFASQADAQVLDSLKEIAKREGRQFQALLDEALRDYIEKKQTGKARKHVLAAYEESVVKFDALYAELAK
jgi:predicted SpoU family rRNA methylase